MELSEKDLKECLEDCLENCLEDCLEDWMEDFHELHACFIGGLDLWQKVHATGTCDGQIPT